jgi:hypothetical protein
MRLPRGVPMLAALFATVLVPCATAQADPSSGTETITMTMEAPPLPPSPPERAPFTGVYQAVGPITDAGSINGIATFTAFPSPTVGVLHFVATLTGSQGTLELRCDGIAKSADTSTSNCTVLDAAGAYTILQGSGKATGVAFIDSNGVLALTDTLTLPTH